MKRRRVLPLLAFVPAVSPRLKAPTHLAPLVAIFERASAGEEVHAFATTPPRHGKTELEKHAIARFLLMRPDARVGLASYSSAFAEKKSREVRELYRRAGGHVDPDASSKHDWRTGVGDGGVWAGGIEGSWTGEGFDLLVIDDPVKDRATAESGVEREKLWDWHNDVAFTRLEPGGSEIVVHTRWTPDDLGGRLARDGWEHVHLPAIDDEGKALWPERYPLDRLARIRQQIGEYGWASLYMGAPYPRGGQVFNGVVFYDQLPTETLRIAIGIDLAYSTKSHADYSVAVVLGEHLGKHYLLEVVRVQLSAPDFITRLSALRAKYGNPRIHGFFSGTEKGVIDTMRTLGLSVDASNAGADKFTRAQPVAAAWNHEKILVPRSAPWLDAFVSEIVSFTGVGDVHDDQVDALAGAFHATARLARIGGSQSRSSFVRRPDLFGALGFHSLGADYDRGVQPGSGLSRLIHNRH